jgi:hypothetical protein
MFSVEIECPANKNQRCPEKICNFVNELVDFKQYQCNEIEVSEINNRNYQDQLNYVVFQYKNNSVSGMKKYIKVLKLIMEEIWADNGNPGDVCFISPYIQSDDLHTVNEFIDFFWRDKLKNTEDQTYCHFYQRNENN